MPATTFDSYASLPTCEICWELSWRFHFRNSLKGRNSKTTLSSACTSFRTKWLSCVWFVPAVLLWTPRKRNTPCGTAHGTAVSRLSGKEGKSTSSWQTRSRTRFCGRTRKCGSMAIDLNHPTQPHLWAIESLHRLFQVLMLHRLLGRDCESRFCQYYEMSVVFTIRLHRMNAGELITLQEYLLKNTIGEQFNKLVLKESKYLLPWSVLRRISLVWMWIQQNGIQRFLSLVKCVIEFHSSTAFVDIFPIVQYWASSCICCWCSTRMASSFSVI